MHIGLTDRSLVRVSWHVTAVIQHSHSCCYTAIAGKSSSLPVGGTDCGVGDILRQKHLAPVVPSPDVLFPGLDKEKQPWRSVDRLDSLVWTRAHGAEVYLL